MTRKWLSGFLAAFLALTQFGGILFFNNTIAVAQDSKNALFRGYRTGYSDGYMAGYRDSVEKAERNYEKHKDYVKAARAYSSAYGKLEDYRDGYQQGFSQGYETGYGHREFDSTVPETLNPRGAKPDVSQPKAAGAAKSNESVKTSNGSGSDKSKKPRATPIAPKNNSTKQTPEYQEITASSEPTIIIPANTELIVELMSGVGTKTGRRGDTFQARIVAPYEIENAIIEGRVDELIKPGRIKRRAKLRLSFDRIVLSEARWSNMNAMIVETLAHEANLKSNIKNVDEEGVVQGKSSLRSDVIVVGATTTTGVTFGAVTGGPVGAAVGAVVGSAVGLSGVLVSRGKDINLAQGQRLRIRTGYETQIR